MSRRSAKKKGIKLRTFYRMHQYMGVGAAVFVLLIAITGIMLNHTDDFTFDKTYVQSDWVLDWYGIKAPENPISFYVENQYITLMGEDLYFNSQEIGNNYQQLIGAISVHGLFVIAVNQSIILLSEDGEIIDTLHEADGVPAGIQGLGVDAKGSVVVKTLYEHYQPDDDFLVWQRQDPVLPIDWASSSTLSTSFKTQLHHHYRGETLPVERVLLDLHSGRFFGRFTPWLFDAIAVLLTALALSGTWLWFRRQW